MSAEENLTAIRLFNEITNLNKDPEYYYQICQDKDNKLLFYFMIHGSGDYDGGYYIGKIVLPKTYPIDPGNFYMLTPQGRFKTSGKDNDEKICLTNSGYHKESWTPMWNIKNMVIAFVSIFQSDDTTGISHIKQSPKERKEMAKNSMIYNLEHYRDITMMFTQFVKPDGTARTEKEVKQYIAELKASKNKKKEKIVKDGPILSTVQNNTNANPTNANPTNANTIKTDPIKADPIKANPVKAVPVKADPIKAVTVKADPIKAKAVPVKADPVKADPVKVVPVKAVTVNKTVTDKEIPKVVKTNTNTKTKIKTVKNETIIKRTQNNGVPDGNIFAEIKKEVILKKNNDITYIKWRDDLLKMNIKSHSKDLIRIEF